MQLAHLVLRHFDFLEAGGDLLDRQVAPFLAVGHELAELLDSAQIGASSTSGSSVLVMLTSPDSSLRSQDGPGGPPPPNLLYVGPAAATCAARG